MIQKTIRDWGSVEFTTTEGAEQQTEWNDRTVYATDGYNSIAELGAGAQAIEAKTDFITVTQAVNLDTMESSIATAAQVGSVNIFTQPSNIFNTDLIIKDIDATFAAALLIKEDDNSIAVDLGFGGGVGNLTTSQTIFQFTGAPKWVIKDDGGVEMAEVDQSVGMSADVNTIALIDSEGSKILTTHEYTEQQYGAIAAVAANTAKITYPSADSTKVGHISVTQAVNLDTIESDTTTNNAKVTYDDAAQVATNKTNADASKVKTDLITVTQAVDLDTMESDITDRLKSVTVGEPTGSNVLINSVSLTQAQYDQGVIDLKISSTTFYLITDA